MPQRDFDFVDDENGGHFVLVGGPIAQLRPLLAKGDVDAAVRTYEETGSSARDDLLQEATDASFETKRAIAQLFTKARDFGAAALVLQKAQLEGEAAAAFEQAGQFPEAAAAWARAGEVLKAAAAFERAGQTDEALALYRVKRPGPGLQRSPARDSGVHRWLLRSLPREPLALIAAV